MPIITRKELSELCGDLYESINKYIERGKFIHLEGNKKLIDTDNAINALFIQQRQEFNAGKGLESVPKISKKEIKVTEKPIKIPKEPKNIPKKPDIVTTEAVTKTAKNVTKLKKEPVEKPVKIKPEKPQKFHVEHPRISADQLAFLNRTEIEINERARIKVDQEAEKRRQELELTSLRIQSEKIRLDKTAGNLLPVDLAMGVIERHGNSCLKPFEKGFQNIAEIYVTMAGFGPTERANFLKECRVELERCIKEAGEQAEAEIDILVDNYSQTLMVGQKKA